MKILRFMVASCFLISLVSVSAVQASDQKVKAQEIVDKSVIVINSFATDPNLDWFRKKVKDAKALLVIPQSIKGAFLIGGAGGSGALVVQDGTTGNWGYPAFYTLGSLSFGLQAGAESSEVVLMVMTDRGMESLLTSSFKLGADATFAVGPVGGGAKAATADILSYSRSKGAFLGMSFDGAVIKTKDKYNEGYYGKAVSPTDIIVRKSAINPDADTLRAAVAGITSK
jgi:lipid-binding SYLF domain-containing protein